MSGTAYIATPAVRHIAAWTADDITLKDFRHQWRPICGQHARPSHVLWGTDIDPRFLSRHWRKRFEAAMRKPVCKDCIHVAHEAYTLAGGAL